MEVENLRLDYRIPVHLHWTLKCCHCSPTVQSNLDYPDSLGPQEIVRIIEGPDNRKYEYYEEQNQAKRRYLIVKQQFYKSFGIQYRLHLHFHLLWKERITKTSRSWINVRDASFFVFHAIERGNSLSNNATLIQSELIRIFFITYDKRERCFCSLRAKTLAFDCTFQCCSFKKIWLRILIVTNKYSWPNWVQRKSLDNREIRIVEVRIIEIRL